MTFASMAVKPAPFMPVGLKPSVVCSSYLPISVTSSSLSIRNLWGVNQEKRSGSVRGDNTWHLSAASTLFLIGDKGSIAHTISMLPRQCVVGHKACRGPRAEKTAQKGFQYPKMTKKPRFWWRTLACLPYIMPLHEPWMYAQTAYQLHPFLETYQYLTYPFLRVLGRLPNWFLLAYFFIGYLGVVRRKEWPHFFRFHVVSGMLLEILLQVVGIVYRWLPSGFYWGKIGMHFWVVIAFGYLFTVLECIRCALTGMYADVPFVASAAYIQIPVDQSGPQG